MNKIPWKVKKSEANSREHRRQCKASKTTGHILVHLSL